MGGDRGGLGATIGGAEVGGAYCTFCALALEGREPFARPNSLYDGRPFVIGGGAVGGAAYVALARPPPTRSCIWYPCCDCDCGCCGSHCCIVDDPAIAACAICCDGEGVGAGVLCKCAREG